MCFHIRAQHRVHPGVEPFARAPEPSQHIAIDAQGDIFLARWQDEPGFGPVDVKGAGIGVFGNGARDILVGHRIEASVISFIVEEALPSPGSRA